ncbi:MAG: peptidylprolyl isomerase [Cyclobacteriaceae bacterium]|nr:peptidylprolyl isomerase [Cyclobacteriaceae bacterium HetDA_MAG_MS6]
MAVQKNDTVKVHYTGKLTNGEVFDSSEGKDPLQFVVGAGQMIKGFDAAVDGMELNEKKTVTIPSNEAYGSVNNDLVQQIDRNQLPEDLKPAVGQTLVATGDGGQQMQVLVTEVTDTSIKIDGNHPLAGKDLVFDIELVEVA